MGIIKALMFKIKNFFLKEIEMNEDSSNQTDFQSSGIGLDIFELIMALWNRKKLLLAISMPTVIITAIVSLLMTPMYLSYTTFLPISSSSTVGLGASSASVLSEFTFGKWDYENKRIMAVLKSRTIKENIVNKLDLVNVFWNTKSKERKLLQTTIDMVEIMTSIGSDRESGIISVAVKHEDAKIARDIANQFVHELQNILNSKSFSVAKIKRDFIEDQLGRVKERLKKQQQNLTSYQKKTKIIQPDQQLKGTFQQYTDLMSKKTELQVKLKSIETALAPGSPLLKSLRNQLAMINRRIRKLERGRGKSVLPSMSEAPDAILKYTDLKQGVEVTKTIYNTLIKMHEQTKLEEAQQSLFVQVIDPAIIPHIRVWPRRKPMVAKAGIVSLLFGVFLVLFLEWFKKNAKTHKEKQGM